MRDTQYPIWLLVGFALLITHCKCQYTCPISWNPSPCYCDNGVASCNITSAMHEDEDLKKIFQKPSTPIKLKSLNIVHTLMEKLPAKLFGQFTFEKIRITNSKLSLVDIDTFNGQESSLKELLLLNGAFKTFNFGSIKNLRTLQKFSLMEHELQEIPTGAFADMKALETVFLAFNNIAVIHKKAFTGLPNLRVINLSHNNINYIDAVAFNLGLSTGPIAVYLNENSITSTGIHRDAFQEGTQLKMLFLSHNKLTTLTEDFFKHIVDKMERLPGSVLEVSENPFQCDGSLEWIVSKSEEYKSKVQGLICPNGKELKNLTSLDLSVD